MPVEPTEADLLLEVMRSYMLDVHTCMLARVDSYDEATETIKCTPCVRRARLNDSREIIKEDLPQLADVRVAWPSGGGYSLVFELKKGDFVTLVHPETATGVFRTTGDVPSNPGEIRTHSLGDAVAIPGGAAPNGSLPTKLIKIDGDGNIELGGTTLIGDATKIYAELGKIATATAPGSPAYVPPLTADLIALTKVKGS